jgi:predicted DNA-binding transcriptional regulator YafY
VTERTVRRDVGRLRDLGYPVGSSSGPAGGYRLAAGTAMPPLLLDEEEAVAIAVGLRTAARAAVTGIEETSLRALVKLEQVLPAHLRRRVRAVGDALALPQDAGPTVDPQHLALLAAAHRDGERVRFGYRRRDGVTGRRDVEPHALVALGRRWYLVGWDVARDDWRTFRIDRIATPSLAGRRFGPRELPGDGDAAAYVAAGRWETTGRHVAVVTVHLPADDLRRRVGAGWGTVTAIDADTCEFRTGDDDVRWLALRLAMIDAEMEVLGPPELRDRLRDLAGRLSRAAGGRPG